MKVAIQTRVALGVLAIFVAGGIAGAFVGARLQLEAQNERASIKNLPENVMDMLDQRLALTKEQSDRLRPLVEKAGRELHGVYKKNYSEVGAILGRYYENMSEVLDDNQKKTLIEMESVLRAKAEELKGHP